MDAALQKTCSSYLTKIDLTLYLFVVLAIV